MKIVTVLEQVPIMQPMSDSMERGARSMGGVDYKAGDWLEEATEDYFQNAALTVEKKGPNALPVPKFLAENTDADIMVGTFCPFSKELMDRCPNLHLLGIARGGLESVNLEEATAHGIAVFNAAGRNANAVSDFAVGMMLSEIRNIAKCHFLIKTGKGKLDFPNSEYTPDMEGKTVGLVGLGNIGRLVAKKLSGFDVRVLAYDPFLKPEAVAGTNVELVDKGTLFRESDIVSIHARLTADTFHLITKADIDSMKPHAYFINTARAGLVDYDALYDALAEKRIAGAALDVYYEEPLPEDSRWKTLDNITLTSHLAGATYDAQANSPLIVFKKMKAFIENGDTQGVLNKDVLGNASLQAWLLKK